MTLQSDRCKCGHDAVDHPLQPDAPLGRRNPCQRCACTALTQRLPAGVHVADKTRTEWHVESIGGGITGTEAEVRAWVESWVGEYGDEFPIELQRRTVTETPWEDVTPAALTGTEVPK